jgi:serine/threonine protein phosphatase PrpC
MVTSTPDVLKCNREGV